MQSYKRVHGVGQRKFFSDKDWKVELGGKDVNIL